MFAVEFRNITKTFPGIIANSDVSFKIKKGTIHALIGENGAGKSTLMSILFGLYEQTSGEILVNGNKVLFTGPNDANEAGIGMVHQHFKLVDIYTNLDNIILGDEWVKKFDVINRNIAIKKIKALQNTYNLHFDLFQKSGDATVSTQQKVEIMKMLYRGNEILVFDEPTAVLTDEEIQGLLQSFEIFKKAGKTIIFISHKLKEIEQVADTATVLRLGKVAGNFDVKNTTTEELIKAMVGSDVIEVKNSMPATREDVVFSLKNISTHNLHKNLKNISFDVHAGEIFAIAGISGNGQEELEHVVGGLVSPSKGSIFLRVKDNKNNTYALKDITKKSAYVRSKDHMAYIPADRHHHGVILDYTIEENSIIRRLWDKQFQSLGVLKQKNIAKFTDEIIQKYDVRSSQGAKSIARSLSGGNQQKFIVGREMLFDHDFIIIVQPTRGMDIGAITNIHSEIIKEKQNGKAILLISYELDEVLALADTIAVINEGRILSIQDAKDVSRQQIGKFMSSSTNDNADIWFDPENVDESRESYLNIVEKKYNSLIEKSKLNIATLKSALYIAKTTRASKDHLDEIKQNFKEAQQQLQQVQNEHKNQIKEAKNNFEIIFYQKLDEEHADIWFDANNIQKSMSNYLKITNLKYVALIKKQKLNIESLRHQNKQFNKQFLAEIKECDLNFEQIYNQQQELEEKELWFDKDNKQESKNKLLASISTKYNDLNKDINENINLALQQIKQLNQELKSEINDINANFEEIFNQKLNEVKGEEEAINNAV
ncbi:ATP-binding cassette domain-containing protein [Mycoplasmopsis mucosicanis]|uniref:ATP-binding cassette domain-containing protein n=1 Tax=Mycoplasmopsis mucosicanis TaxID=458208 RepID=A0A507SYN5_9BACT|nr:ABC transporter ATP-binding protein [Mycoplasmopsis mucosicanis]TQC54228.1 ATP-binding cassette domain-containing protein [Mycoplasmopsis mucosicanis]